MALTWFEHRRTTELCAGLGMELVVLRTGLRGLPRYVTLSFRTLWLLVRRRPRVLLVQNPSLVLTLLATVVRPIFGYRLVVDAHNEAVTPFVNRRYWIARLSRWLVKRAALTIITNRQLAAQVVQQGGTPFVLPDRVPTPPEVGARRLSARFSAVLISTYAPDEPIAEIFAAAGGIDIDLYVTGNARKLDRQISVPPNVHLTGFLSEQDYWIHLRSADAVIDLTLIPDCLVCGAYEALALGKPMLLSNNTASIELFGKSACFTDNTPADIRRCLLRLPAERPRLQAEAATKAMELRARWADNAAHLAELIGSLAGLGATA